MEREDVLDATPCPVFTPTASCTLIPTSDPSATTSVLKSEVDTDEMNPDKRTYNPGSTMDDSDRDLSVTPIAKRTYAKVASPKCKPGVATSTKNSLRHLASELNTRNAKRCPVYCHQTEEGG